MTDKQLRNRFLWFCIKAILCGICCVYFSYFMESSRYIDAAMAFVGSLLASVIVVYDFD